MKFKNAALYSTTYHHRLLVGILSIFLFISFQFPAAINAAKRYAYTEKQRYDGWFNNLAHPDWGTVDSQMTRKTPPSYADGVYMMVGDKRPSPRTLSTRFMKGQDGLSSVRNRTALLAFFGQVVSSEIVMGSEKGCPIEVHDIEIEKCDSMYDSECKGGKSIPFHRAGYDRRTGQSPNNPRQQINRVTSWIDGSFIYSTSEAWVNTMRSFVNGTLLTDKTGKLPIKNTMRVPLFNNPVPHVLRTLSPERLFLLGDPRSNQNPALLAFSILWYRWHNVIANAVQREHPDWPDEEVFQRARRIVIASLQNIVAYEYIPAFLGQNLTEYNGYNVDVHPGISHVFQTAAFRFGHTLIPPGIYRRDGRCNFKKSSPLRLCSHWWDSSDVISDNTVEEMMMGMASQLAEREDSILCSDVRDKLFGPNEFSRRDLAALNVMRGRDNGIADYNTVRPYFRLKKIKSMKEINPELFEEHPELAEYLGKEYGSVDNIDLYIGGMLESKDGPGELFTAIIFDQFTRLRDADRFWFENVDNGIFTKEEIENIKNIKLWDIIVNTSDVPPDALQKNVFFWNEGDPCPQPEQLNATLLESCEYLKGFDYFEGSELAYLYACVFLLLVPLLCAGAGYCVVKWQDERKRKFRMKQEALKSGAKVGGPVDKMCVREWLHANHKRFVKLRFGPESILHTVNRKGEKLRSVNFSNYETITIEESQNLSHGKKKRPLVLIHVPKDHDLVLEFDSLGERRKFINKIEAFLNSHKKHLIIIQASREILLAKAETKERRQKRLEHFFREAYALTFGLKPGERRADDEAGEVVMRTSLSRAEFANALGMKPHDVFVRMMFNIVDKDGDGKISFQEFLDTVVLFSRGKTEDKLRIIFDMCDNDRNGVIDKGELSEMLRSLVEIARTTSLSDEHVTKLIDGMFQFRCVKQTSEIVFNEKFLEIEKNSMKVKRLTNGNRNIEIVRQYLSRGTQIVVLLSEDLLEDNHYEIEMKFSSKFRSNPRGLVFATYEREGVNSVTKIRRMVFTNMDEFDTQIFFPCFGQINMKATFKIHFAHRKSVMAFSNAKFASSEDIPEKEGWIMEEYETTKPMETFSIAAAFVDSEALHMVESTSDTFAHVWVDETVIHELKSFGEMICQIYAFFSTYFGMHHPLEKLTFIILPGMPFEIKGGYGLIMINETYVLEELKKSSQSATYNLVSKVCRAVSEQWIGHTVTMSTWETNWLFEGLNHHLQTLCVKKLYPEYEFSFLELDMIDSFINLLKGEEEEEYEPIKLLKSHPDFVFESMEYMSLERVHQLVRMIDFILGPDLFHMSLVSYLDKFKGINSHLHDVWNEFTTVANWNGGILANSVTINDFVESWLAQNSHPMVRVLRDERENKIYLNQEIFQPWKVYERNEIRHRIHWIIPMSYKFKTERGIGKIAVREWMIPGRGTIMDGFANALSKDEWVLFNLELNVPARTDYSDSDWLLIQKSLLNQNEYYEIGALTRVRIGSDLFALAQAGKLSYKIVFNIMKYLAHEEYYAVLKVAFEEFDRIRSSLLGSNLLSPYVKYIRKILKPIFQREEFINLKFSPENYSDYMLKILIMKFSCKVGVKACREKSMQLHGITSQISELSSETVHIPSAIHKVISCERVKQGDENYWNGLWQRYIIEIQPSLKEDLLETLGCSEDPKILERFLKISISTERISRKDRVKIFEILSNHAGGYKLMKTFFKTCYDSIKALHPEGETSPFSFLNILFNITVREKDLKELENFADSVNLDMSNELTKKSMERARRNILWFKRSGEELKSYFGVGILNWKLNMFKPNIRKR